MTKKQANLLVQRLQDESIDVMSLTYIDSYPDSLSIYFYKDERDSRFIFSTEIQPDGRETTHRRAKVWKS